MRRVQVYKWDFGNRAKAVKVDDGDAWFHEWGVNYTEFESGPGPFSTAIIERDDGTIETPQASMIRFLKT